MAEETFLNASGFKPVGHRVVVQPESVETVSQGGIVLAKSVSDKEQMSQIVGTVVAVGDGAWKDTSTREWAAPGDKVVFAKFAGLKWQGKDGKEYRILSDLDVVGIVF